MQLIINQKNKILI